MTADATPTTSSPSSSTSSSSSRPPPMSALREAIARTPATMVPLGRVHESPFNRRRTWGNLEELAQSFGSVGILEDLLGRPHPKKKGEVELVFGHRRLRAAGIAKLAELPIKVRALSDDQVVECQAIENLQRTDIHEMEEAETFELLRERQKLSVDDLAKKVGKSRAYVYARLKLLDLVPEARKAFAADELTASVALYVARMPAALQAKALKELTRKDYRGEVPSARDAFHLISTRYMLKLADAPFDRGDATLVPKAGACTTCPLRTGSQPELFADVDSADVCTSPPCFEEKRVAHVKQKRVELEQKGVKVLEPKKQHDWMYPPDGYVPLSERIHSVPSGSKAFGKPLATILKGAKQKVDVEKVVYFDDKGNAVPVVARTKVPSLLKAAGIAGVSTSSSSSSRSSSSAYRTKPVSAEDKARAEADEEIRERRNTAIVSAAEKKGMTDELLRIVIGGLGDPTKLKKLAGPKLVAYAAQVALDEDYGEDYERLAKVYGVDLKALEKEVLGKLAPPAPAKDAKAVAKAAKQVAKKKGAGKGKKK